MQNSYLNTFLFLFALIAGLASLDAQDIPAELTPAEEPPVTEILFDETVYEFGTVLEGELVTHVYTFTNTGTEPLVISNAKGSCGCTVPRYPTDPIAPGETASLTVQFNSKSKKGERNQKVTITANTSPPQTFLYVVGRVEPRTEDDPEWTPAPSAEAEAALSAECFAIYPNPTAEFLKLDVEETSLGEAAEVVIYSKEGQLMAKREIAALDGTVEFSVGHYPAGTYVANVRIGDRKPQARCFVVVH